MASEEKGTALHEQGADAAAEYLRSKGYDILEQGWECEHGEVDIIAIDHDALVFAEVAVRDGRRQGFPSGAVRAAKRDKAERCALAYLLGSDAVDMAVRFDVVAVMVMPPDRAFIRHHISAFSSGEGM